MDNNDIQTPDDPQVENAAAPAESAPEAPAESKPEETTADVIAAAVGISPEVKPDDAQDEPAEEAAPKTDEEKAKAEDAKLEAEAQALGLTKPDTTAKFKELSRAAARAREMEPEIEDLRAQVAQQQEVFDHLERNGITGEQFGEMVMITSFMNSGDPLKLQRAHEALMRYANDIGKQLGLESPGFDPLSDHPDLIEAVQNMDIDRKHALEVAQARQLRAATTSYSSQQGQAQLAQAEQQRVVRELTALEQSLRSTDPQFEQKWAMLRPTLVPVLERLPLSERANAFKQAYAALQLPAAPVAAAQRRPDPANPGRPAMGAGAKAPTNTAEAIMQSLQLG